MGICLYLKVKALLSNDKFLAVLIIFCTHRLGDWIPFAFLLRQKCVHHVTSHVERPIDPIGGGGMGGMM
jgi:hypothetical protein